MGISGPNLRDEEPGFDVAGLSSRGSFSESAAWLRSHNTSVQQQLVGKEITIIQINPYELSEATLEHFDSRFGPYKERLTDASQAIVVVCQPNNVELYDKVLAFLGSQGQARDALYGLILAQDGTIRLHHAHTECFVGYRDVRSQSTDTHVLEHLPEVGTPGYGYEFSTTEFDFSLLKNPQALLQARTWSDYLPILPLGKISVELGETVTPVLSLPTLASELNVKRLLVKDESKTFTGSFKDRQTFVLVNKAVEDGCTGITINSSGNAAISAAAYARKAGIHCTAVVPSYTSDIKRALIREFGAHIVERDGNYETNHRHLLAEGSEARNITPGATCLGLDGIKLIAYELVAQSAIPTVIIAPSGNGSLVAGLFKGFRELRELGVIERIPKIVSVQIEGAAPLRRALEEGQLFSRVENIPDSKAEAILAEESFSSPIAIQALLQTDGEVIEVSDSELHVWQQRLRKDFQIVSEFSSAAAFAALHKLELSPNDIVAVVNTATGMRDLVQQLKIQGAMEPTTNRRQTGEQNQSVEKVQARVLTTLDELADCENLQAAAFGFEDREITPREVLSVIQQTGGLIVGVYEGPNLVAFSSAFLSRDSKGLFLHSDLAAVQPDLQSQGLGKILKEAQREFALQMGFERIRWTYDPMLTKNANLNIKKLGGCAVEFKRDVYGQSSSELYANLPTHRLVIEWDLKSNPEARDIPQDAAIALQNIGGSPSVSQVPMGSSAVVAEVPLNYLSIKDQSIKKAAQWQDEFARTAEGLFALGYVINGFERDDQRQAGRYLFSKREL